MKEVYLLAFLLLGIFVFFAIITFGLIIVDFLKRINDNTGELLDDGYSERRNIRQYIDHRLLGAEARLECILKESLKENKKGEEE